MFATFFFAITLISFTVNFLFLSILTDFFSFTTFYVELVLIATGTLHIYLLLLQLIIP